MKINQSLKLLVAGCLFFGSFDLCASIAETNKELAIDNPQDLPAYWLFQSESAKIIARKKVAFCEICKPKNETAKVQNEEIKVVNPKACSIDTIEKLSGHYRI